MFVSGKTVYWDKQSTPKRKPLNGLAARLSAISLLTAAVAAPAVAAERVVLGEEFTATW